MYIQSPDIYACDSKIKTPMHIYQTSCGCCRMITRVSTVIGVSGKQLHTHTTVGRLRNKQKNNTSTNSVPQTRSRGVNALLLLFVQCLKQRHLTCTADKCLSCETARREESRDQKMGQVRLLQLQPFKRMRMRVGSAWRGFPYNPYRPIRTELP